MKFLKNTEFAGISQDIIGLQEPKGEKISTFNEK